MDCGVQVEVSKLLLAVVVVMGGGVVLVRQLQALEMRWKVGLVGQIGLSEVGGGGKGRGGGVYGRAAGCDTAWCCLGAMRLVR